MKPAVLRFRPLELDQYDTNHQRYVSHSALIAAFMIRPGGGRYGGAMQPDADATGAAFAALLRAARRARSASQDDVIAATGVSRSTYLRWEAGNVGRPDPGQVTQVCRFLRLNPPEAALALGFGSDTDYQQQAQEPPFEELIVDIGRILADDAVPQAARAALRHAVRGAFESWQMAMAIREPHEPSGNDLARRPNSVR